MTFRAKPAGRRRSSVESSDRRNLYLNVGFGLVVVGALIILVVVAAANWYGDHLEPVGSVNGSSITKDEFIARGEIELFRIAIQSSRVEDEFNAGRIDQADRERQQEFLTQRRQQIDGIVLEQLIDTRVQAALAAREGVTVSEADIDAGLARDATNPEQRRVWLIEVEPEVDDDAEEPTAAQVAAARTTAQAALADLEAGKAWEEVAKARSTSLNAATGGDIGYQFLEGQLEQPLADAVFALADDAHTGVLEGDDGVFRIARVTEIVPAREDPNFMVAMENAGISVEGYREAVRADVTRRKLEDKIKEQALADGPQRRVAEIWIPTPEVVQSGGELAQDAVRVRHILFSPKDDPEGARTLAADDPAWKAAEDEARAAHARVTRDPDVFDEIAREDTDDIASADAGGKQDYYSSESSQLDPAFAAAILVPGLQPGQLLDPVRGQAGWHLIQIMYRAPDLDRARAIKAAADSGTSFGELAWSDSYGPEAADDGELGWIARYQLEQALEDAIFATPVGKVSEPVEGADGIHLYLVEQEQVRPLDAEQKALIEEAAFPNWYIGEKDAFEIHRAGEEEEAAV
jgi:parvulin-like peptidyl-prolyl isomerase